MAQVVWSEEAMAALTAATRYGRKEFGQKVARDFYHRIKENDLLLQTSPEIGKVEPLLEGCRRIYRSLVVHRHYKLIYYIEEDVVRISSLWDTRREPAALVRHIK